MKIVELRDKQMNQYLQEFCQCIETGYDFENFIKLYLESIGLDEIQVTKRSRDGGIDLIAVRNGIGDFSNSDSINYYIQVKKYCRTKVGVKIIRELKGVVPFGHKGLLITTSDFTKDAIKESDNDVSKPVTLVNGKTLLSSCIKNGIGFTFEPIFSKAELKKYIKNHQMSMQENLHNKTKNKNIEKNYIEKEITENDVRARIISVPSKIASSLQDRKKYNIIFEKDIFSSKFIGGRNYFSAGFTQIYKKYNLLSKDNIITSKKAFWKFENNTIRIKLKN